MRILFVCNNASIPGNGICTSVRTTVAQLRKAGIDAKVLAGENADLAGPQPDFRLKRFYFPLFQPIIEANGFCYASRDRKIIRQAVEWADVVHIQEPFLLQKTAIRMAKKLGKTVTGTFHMYTENLLSEIPGASWKWSNHLLMLDWKNHFFNHCSDIQCPSQTVRNLLEDYGFKSRLHVISNGIEIPEEPVTVRTHEGPPYLIINVGRFATKKDQITLLRAMRYSRHAKNIQLHFAGNGQLIRQYEREAGALVKEGILKHRPVFAFYNAAQLKELAAQSYLYVHCATIEVEGLGCMEAIREGTVPIIAKGERIATSDFALDERSTFPVRDARALAEKIDWWIEHPRERNEMARRYADSARGYSVEASVEKLIAMFRQALHKDGRSGHDERNAGKSALG